MHTRANLSDSSQRGTLLLSREIPFSDVGTSKTKKVELGEKPSVEACDVTMFALAIEAFSLRQPISWREKTMTAASA